MIMYILLIEPPSQSLNPTASNLITNMYDNFANQFSIEATLLEVVETFGSALLLIAWWRGLV